MYSDRPEFSLQQLADIVQLYGFDPVLQALEAQGCHASCPLSGWQALSGGRESALCEGAPVQVEGLASHLFLEVSRLQEDAQQAWVDGFDLRPDTADTAAWLVHMRQALTRDYALTLSGKDGYEHYRREASRLAMLFPGSLDEPPRVLLYSGSEFRYE